MNQWALSQLSNKPFSLMAKPASAGNHRAALKYGRRQMAINKNKQTKPRGFKIQI